MPKLDKLIRVSAPTHRKAKLLAVLIDKQINEAVDLALTELLDEIGPPQVTPSSQPKPKTRKRK